MKNRAFVQENKNMAPSCQDVLEKIKETAFSWYPETGKSEISTEFFISQKKKNDNNKGRSVKFPIGQQVTKSTYIKNSFVPVKKIYITILAITSVT